MPSDTREESKSFKFFYKVRFDNDILLLLTLSVIYVFSYLPTVNGSLGLTSLEDGPVLPSRVYENPDKYVGDYRALETKHLMWTSSSKWVPALFLKYIGLSPTYSHFFLTYIQSALLIIGVFMLAKSLTYSRYQTWVITLAFIVVKPYLINVGWYGDLQFMPYTTWIALGPILISWAKAKTLNYRTSVLWMFFGASVHPGMAMVGLMIILVTDPCVMTKVIKLKITFFVFLSLPVVLFGLLSTIAINHAMAEKVPLWWMEEIKKSVHFSAWMVDASDISYPITASFYIQMSVFALLILTNPLHQELKSFTKNIILVVSFAIGLQAIGFIIDYKTIYTISFGRITLFSQIAIFIVTITILLRESEQFREKKIRLENSWIAFLVVFPAPIICIATMIVVAFSRWKRASKEVKLMFIGVFALQVLLYSAILTRRMWAIPSYSDFLIRGYSENQTITISGLLSVTKQVWPLTLALCVGVFVLLSLRIDLLNRKKAVIALLIVQVIFTLLAQFRVSLIRDSSNEDWVSTQLWAREYSGSEDMFLVNTGLNVYDSWGTLSNRARVIANSQAGYAYFYTDEDEKYNQRIKEISNKSSSAKNSLEYYVDIALSFNADYAVVRSTQRLNESLLCYTNKTYSIYSIAGPC